MKKFITILIAILLSLSSITVYADTVYNCGISLCYASDAYSVDYVLDLPEGVEIISVSVNDENCFYDWNYVESETRLYISIASANVIPKAETIANISMVAELPALLPITVKVNGKRESCMSMYHAPVPMTIPPGFDTPGCFGGKVCSNCGIVLEEPQTVKPTGPIVSAILDTNETLTVSGGVSDNNVAEGATYLAIYDKDMRMLCFKNITELDQSDFSVPIENMQDANTVKILRWGALSVRPLHSVVELNVVR